MIRPFSALLLPSQTLPPLEYHLINTYTYTHIYMSLHVFFVYLSIYPLAQRLRLAKKCVSWMQKT